MGKKYDVVAAMGEYTDRQGQTKVRWQHCGSIFEKGGKFSLKLDVVPVGNTWEGWFKLFEPKQQQASSKVNEGRASAGQAAQSDDFDDSIPF